jgi:hypothetical protein
MKIYFLGAPFSKELETDQIRNFLNDLTPTIWVCNSGGPNRDTSTFDGWNWFRENNFTTGVGLDNLEVVSDERVLYSSNIFSKRTTTATTAKKLIKVFENLHIKFPAARLVYITMGSPYLYDNVASSVMQLSDSELSVECIDVKNSLDDNINNFQRVATILGELTTRKPENAYFDRSGIFFYNENPNIPKNTYTEKSYAQIVDETALTYLNKNPVVAWSGGIDSTTILAAFYKNKIPFRVTINEKSQLEHTELYDYVVNNFETINISNDLILSEVDLGDLVVTGEGNDQLYPRIAHNLIPGRPTFKELITLEDFETKWKQTFDLEVDEKYLYNNVREYFIDLYSRYYNCNTSDAVVIYENYLLPKIEKFPFEVKHFYQLMWFFKFIFKWQDTVTDRFAKKTELDPNKVVSFYNTEDFQRWAITNLDNNFNQYSMHYLTYKQPSKDYSYSVFKMESILQKTKYPSA